MAQLAARVVLTRDDFIVRNHRVHGVAVLPGVAFLDIVFRMLAAAGEDVTRAVLRDVVFTEAVAADEGRDREIVCEIDADVDGMRAVRARSRWLGDGAESSPWSQNIAARLVFRDEPTPLDLDIKALQDSAVRVGDMSELYARARREDIDHGAPMRCSGPLYFGESSLLAHLTLEKPGDGQEEQFHLHPAKLDASTLAGFALTEVSGQHPFIPMFIQEFRAPRSIAGPCYLYVPRPETLAPSGDVITSDYALYDAEGRYLAGFQGLTCKRIRHPELITRLLPVLPEAEPAVDSPADANRLAEHLRTLIADRLGRAIEDIRTDVGFYELGLDSLALMDLGRELESAVGQALYPTLLFEYSDITSLAAHLVANYDVTLPQVTAAVDEALPEAEPAVTEFRAPRWASVPAEPADVAATVIAGPEAVDSELLADDIAVEIPADTDVETATRTLWRLAVSAAARTSTGPIRLTAVCRTPDLDAPIPAALAALARTITAETPQIRCRVVTGQQNSNIRSLLQIAGDDPVEAEIRIIDGRRQVRRWDLVPAADGNRQQVLRNGGAYLITGGAGGIAGLLTSHLVDRYGARVMLAGRRPEPAELGPVLREWNQRGGDVRYVEADVSGTDGGQRAIDAAREAFGMLNGVIHCAGVRRDRLYFRKEADDFAAVFGPKAHGTSALDAALGDSELDFFAVFSSVSATLANPGQADYAAANACAEAVVQRRASRPDRRGRSVAIAWPYWASGAMTVADDVVQRAAAEKGTAPLPTAQALTAFEDALAAGEPRLVVLHGDGGRIRDLLPMPEQAPEAVSAPDTTNDVPDATDDIAIIGMAGRFPQAPDVDAFWRNLAAGRDSITEIPADRWDADTDHDTAGWGGFLDSVDRFDPAFFGISRREAELMDPQERMFLTTSWHAVEDAGYAPDALRGRPVGVFAGVMWNHYQLLTDPGTGVAPTAMHSAIANRVSYTLDLTGPSLAVDTACSSSLYALHLAVQSLLLGECELALAGGVNASVHPQKYRQLAHGHWLSEDGRCRSFGIGGSGYVPGEGVGCVVLKPLAAALRDGDQVHGVIRASAVNHGGRTGGVTVPSPVAQASVVAEAVRRAGWAPETIGYVEAHGTGTSLGDPIEVEGLRRALTGERAVGRKVALGSVKSNIGHLEGAAGIAGVIKVLRQMRHGSIAPSLHSGELNPRIDFAGTPFVVPQQLTPWPRWDGQPRRAGVSAFGAGGANCHVLIEEAPVVTQYSESSATGPWLFVLSARTKDALRDQAAALAVHVTAAQSAGGLLERVAGLLGVSPDAVDPSATPRDLALGPADLRLLVDDADVGLDDTIEDLLHDHDLDLAAIATTLQVGRNAMKHRLAVVAGDAAELAEALNRYVGGDESASRVANSGPDDSAAPTDLVEAFTQGELRTVAESWLRGADVPWRECLASIGVPVRRVGLPGYPFQEESVWVGQWQSGTRSRRRAAAVLDLTPVVDTTGPEAELRILDDGLALITMRSPMFTAGLLAGLQDALAQAEADESVRAVVITGAGGVFSMGGTPQALASLAAGEGRFSDVPFLYEGLLRCTLPVVAALQGHASGGGLAFGLFADVAVLAEEADYRANFVAYGFTPGVGATFILEHRLGAAVATELMLTGRALRGSDLSRRGAGVTVVPATRVLATALDLARSMADKPPAAVRALKAELASRMLDRLPAVVEREVAMHEEVLGPEAAAVVQARFARTGQARAGQLPENSAKVGLHTVDELGAGNRPAPRKVELPATGESTVGGAVSAKVKLLAAGEPGADGGAIPTNVELRAADDSGASDRTVPARVDVHAAGEPSLGLTEVLAVVEEVVGDVLYLGPDELDRAVSFAEMGLDSVGAVELIGRLNQRFGTDLDSVAVYDHPTSPALAEGVRAALARSEASVAAALSPEPVVHPEPMPEAPKLARTGQIQLVQIDDAPAAPSNSATVEPIAVIGMSGRFPDAPNLETFWANLAAGRSSIREVPASRWDVQAHYDPDRRVPDRTYSKWAALLADPGAFDAPFFQLSPLDAEAMDPQQRLFLQESWHALEDAGYAADPGGVRRPWGVFVGCGAGDYADLLDQAGLGGTGQAFLGGDPSMLPARVAYLLNLSGPTVALDTACSSSLVAVDLACAALVRGECEMALAGGVAVMTTPKMHVWCSKTGMLSPTGRSAPFDATADGIVLGEAVGVVVLKPLSRALADGDHIHGVIRASGVNGDGRTNGITAPSAAAQAELIARVQARAGIGAEDVGYVEAHGTGTELGDPIEVKALTEVFRRTTDRAGYCGLGSVKGNIGHTTLAAGIAGLLKVLLALRRRQLPPSPGYTTPNPHLDLDSGPFYVVRELTPWQVEAGRDRVATVSSFGFSGTNCHVVVSEAPAGARDEPRREDAEPVLVTLSARTDAALARQVAELAERLDPATPLADVAYTLAVGRRRLARRAAFVASDHEEFRTLLKAFDASSGAQPDADTEDTPTRAALRRLGEDFVAGLDVDLADAMAGPGRRRVSLPTYPFDTKDYWPPVPAPTIMTITATDPVVADHRVGGVPVLPAAAGIAMAIEASEAQPMCLRSLRFLRPVQVVDRVQVRLETAGESFQLEDEQGAYLSGTFATAETEPGALDLATLTDLCERTESAQARYAEFARAGIEYRGDYKIIETLRYGAQDALATLRAVGSVRRPAVLDGAIQAAAPLVTAGEGALLPFAVDCVTVFAPDAIAHYSHVRREAENRFTVSIADESGQICARLEGVALRSAPVAVALNTADSMIFVPEWSEAQPGVPAPASRVAILADPGDPLAHALARHGGDASATIVPFDQASRLWGDPDQPFDTVHLLAPTEPADPVAVTTAAFRVIRDMIDAGLGRRGLTIALVVRGADSAGLIGLGSALAAEQPRWRVRSIDVSGDPAAADAALVTSADGALTVIRDGRPLRRRLVPVEPASPASSPVFRTNGVYVIVGGAGGIGLTLSRHLARTVGARIAWIGRRAEDATIRAARADVESLGGAVRYVSADVADAPALRTALDRTRAEFGPLNGVIHAALQLADRTLSTMTEQDLATVLTAKMTGTVALADAVRDDPLDFLAFFSTALSFAPAPGQGNYAAASTFQDAYALQLRDEGVPAVVVNWGFWGSVGAVAGPEYRTRFTALGIEPIEAEEGIAAFEHLLASGLPQALVVKGTPEGLARLGVVTGTANKDAVAPELAAAMHGYATLDRVARRLLTGRPAVSAALESVAADRAGLAEAVRDLLRRAADDDPAADPERDLVSDHPELTAHLTLLRRCADAVPEVLTGRKSGVEVLLPRGSADDVEAIYRGNPGSDFHHRLLAEQVAERADRIAAEQGRPARILEIGAGTGAGTAFVLRACDDNGSAPFIDFTDVSQAFLSRAEREFGQNHPRMAFRILDLEKDPIEQGFGPQSYDIVLAGNVLHATVDIAATLTRTRTLLRPGGLLLVNEVTRTSDFLTLTFGLTPGWWRFSDPGKRLPHTPLLSARQWKQALAGAGFSVRQIGGIPGLPADRLEQVVVAAQSPAGAEPATARAVRDYVKGVFAEVLKYDVADLDDTAQFDAFGIDSLVSLAIVDRFEADLGELPSTLLFEHQTIAVLADHLRDLRGDRLAEVLGMPQVSPVPVSVAAVELPAVDPEPVVRTERSDDADTADITDIAIIGVAGRYPGSPDLDTFWRNLAAGTDCVTEVPAERWDWREHFDPRRGRPHHTYGKWGGFIDGIDQFDAGFFGVLPRDAAAIDPQERLFLETAWSLLQDAGCLSAGRGRQATGVFVGTMYGSYGRLAAASGWPRGRYTDGHSSYWSIANRVSYTLDLRGPSLAVDSACSSSLTAVHLAAESLRRGECETAIAGGVNLLLHPAHLVALSSMGMLSDDGGCKVFDERANGFAPGEGVGAVLLKPLAAALADGDDVWAVLKGSHLNAGGRTAGYTVPNPNAQAELVVTALRRSGIDPRTLSYVEAHGTGTALGDPIEIAGLTRALREAGAPERCAVGSVKANIGHLEGAAGIAGLTKVLLQMRHGQIVPCANLEQTNPKIDLNASPLYLPTEAVDWPGDSPRRAGVSSFGAGGANAHLVLEGFDSALVSESDSFDSGEFVLLSARSAEQLRAMAGSMADFVQEHSSVAVADIAFTSQVGRAEFAERVAVPASDRDALVDSLRSFAEGKVGAGVVVGSGRESDLYDDASGVAFVRDLIRARDVAKLARLWAQGAPVRWRELWPGGARRRVALPGYPFQRRRFWLPEEDDVRAVTLVGPEATEHRVGGKRWASGAAVLEALGGAVGGGRLSDVRWLAPLDVEADGDRLRIVVERATVTASAGDRVVARAVTDADADLADTSRVVDLAAARARCSQQIDKAGFYAGLRAGGLEHGPGLRPVSELWVGAGEVLARLEASEAGSGRRLNAVLLDGALQTLAAVGDGRGVGWLPVGVDAVRSYAALPERCWAHGRELESAPGRRRFDIAVIDDAGRVLLALDGLQVAAGASSDTEVTIANSEPISTREVQPEVESGRSAIRYLRPSWTSAPAPAPNVAPPATVLLLGVGPVAEAVADHLLAAGSLCLAATGASRADFDLVLADLGGPADAIVHIPSPDAPFEPLLWSAVALLAHPERGAVRIVTASDASVPGTVALAAPLRTLALEHSGFAAATVDSATSARHLLDELARLDVSAPEAERVREVRYVGDERMVRELQEFAPPLAADGLALCAGGVYLVTGGAGGLGRIVARHLSSRAPVTVVLAGRSDLDEATRAELSAIAAPGSRIVYERADVSSADDVAELVSRVRRDHGPLRGLIHAAGVNRDALAVNKDARDIAEVLGAKYDGARHLDAATAREPLDFVVLFSSVAAQTGNLGQVDYTYANACLDEFAADREGRRLAGECSGRTVSIGWPLWEEGGMVAGDAARKLFARRWGSAPLATGDGLVALERAAAAGESCVVVDSVLMNAASASPAFVRRPAELADVEALLRTLASGFLLVDERHVDLDADLMDAGFDSISLTELVGHVNDHYGVDVLPTVLFECVNLAGFARYLVEVEQIGEPDTDPALVLDPVPEPEPLATPDLTPEPSPGPEPIAIVGMAAVLPGSEDLDAFWRHLVAGDDLITPVPDDRSDLRADPRTRDIRGGFLVDVRSFDAALFGISPREAALMDPQQRLFLQTVWRAVEDAGYPASALAGTDTGLFAGVAACDYDDLLRDHGVEIEAHTASGVANCVLANRVSHLLDLHGPSEAIDTACSSALVAVHRAVSAIRSGECSAALAGGVNVLLSPGLFVAFDKSGMLAADGRCKTFDAAADGYVRGEGVGVVYLKSLSQALADRDNIHALIRGSAVNHGGRAPSLTAPNPAAQARVVAAAHRGAGVDPLSVGYIEAHGTGTRLGDPIEIEGLKKAFADLGGEANEPWVALGSVKTNIGHLEAAAGIAGLLKTVLALEHGQLPPTLNLSEPNPLLRLAGTPFRLNDRLRDWRGAGRRAGVSSFGFGGTNAHVVLESAPETDADSADLRSFDHPIVLSAPSAQALTEYADRLADYLTDRPDTDLARFAATLQSGRERLAHRVGFVAADVAQALALLRIAASGADDEQLRRGVVRLARRGSVADVTADALSPEAAVAAWVAGEPAPWPSTPQGVRRLAGVPGFPFARTVHWFTGHRLETSVTPTSPIPNEPNVPGTPTRPERPKLRLAPAKNKTAIAVPPPSAAAKPEPPRVSQTTDTRPGDSLGVVGEHLAAVLGSAREEVPGDVAFADLGLDSILRMDLVRRINAALGIDLKADDLYEHDTAFTLAAHVATGGAAKTSSSPEAAAPKIAARGSAAPEAAAPTAAALAAAAPEAAAPTTAAFGSAALEAAALVTAGPEAAGPATSVLGATAPEIAMPEPAAPKIAARGSAAPEAAAPRAGAPAVAVLGAAAPEIAAPEAAAPRTAALGSGAPTAATLRSAAPEAAMLGAAAPEIAMPEPAAPKIAALGAAAPEAAALGVAAPEAAAPAAAAFGSAAPQAAAVATPAPASASASASASVLASGSATEPLPVRLTERLTALAADTIGRALDPGVTFRDNAFTSFDMLRTIAVLERGFGTLPKTLLFDQPTVGAVAAELVERFGEGAAERFLGGDRGEVVRGRSVGISAEVPLVGESVTVAVLKRSLAEHPDLAALVADLDSVHAKEGGLAGRDIAPYALIGAERLGYFNVSMRADLLFAWSYVGSEEYFPVLAAEFFAYARARGLRPNFLSLLPLESVAGEPITATPFGAVQRLENLPEFSTRGGKMSRLRYMIGHFQKAGESRTQEYRSGEDPEMDRQIARMMDRWAESKDMVNPYVAVVRDEIQAGRLAERHRMFLTYLDEDLANVIIVTRIPSEPGYLMDLEFYPKDGPLGGLEYAIVQIIEALRAEGHTVFSFGASFGVAIGSTEHASAEAEQALAELRTAGIFGEGNFQFKNKFRPVNVPIYLCQPKGADRTPVSEVILTIADPTLTASSAMQSTVIATRSTGIGTQATATTIVTPGWPDLLAAHDWNPLAVPHDSVGEDFVTDSWAELDSDAIRARAAALAAASAHQDPEQRPAWLPFEHAVLTGSGRSAEALLCRAFPARRAAVLHNGLFPTWYGSLIDAGFIPEALGRHADPILDSGPDLDHLTQRLADASRPVSFICLELSCNAAGGVPIRMQTLRAVRDLADRHGVPLVLDATRFAENAAALDAEPDLWRAIREILSLADAATFSLSKDLGLTAGGLLALRDPAWAAAAKQHILTAGRDLTLSGRKQAAFALHDTEAVEVLVRERMAATAALWEELSRAGLPVPQQTSGHCVLLDTTRLTPVAGYGEPLMATLAWIFAETGIRGGPHLGDTPELKQAIRFAVPLGVDRDRTAAAGRRIAALLTSGAVPPDLVAAGDSGSPAAMVYRPAKEVPADVTEALRTGQTVADDNEAVLREACPTLDRRLLPLRGGEVEVFTAGTGPALLMLAPFNIGAGLFAQQFAALSDRFQVIAVHHAGVGATSGIDDISFDGQADLARAALTTLGVDQPAHIAGASFGGLSALSFALRHPDATASLTLIGSSYKIGNRVGEINRLAIVARDDFDAVETACGPERFGGGRAHLEQTLLRCESMDPRTGLRYLDVFAARPDLLAELPRISVPTLVIQGRHDTVVPLKAAYALYGAIPDARFVELDDAGHFPCLTNAEEINALFSELT